MAQHQDSYISYLTGDYAETQLNLMNVNTGETRLIPTGVRRVLDYDWSPDGEKIVFSDGYDIYIIDAEGADRRQVTDSTETVHCRHSRPAGRKRHLHGEHRWRRSATADGHRGACMVAAVATHRP